MPLEHINNFPHRAKRSVSLVLVCVAIFTTHTNNNKLDDTHNNQYLVLIIPDEKKREKHKKLTVSPKKAKYNKIYTKKYTYNKHKKKQ